MEPGNVSRSGPVKLVFQVLQVENESIVLDLGVGFSSPNSSTILSFSLFNFFFFVLLSALNSAPRPGAVCFLLFFFRYNFTRLGAIAPSRVKL